MCDLEKRAAGPPEVTISVDNALYGVSDFEASSVANFLALTHSNL